MQTMNNRSKTIYWNKLKVSAHFNNFLCFSLLEALLRHQQDPGHGQNIIIRRFQVSRGGGGRGQLLRQEEEREERDGELFRG